MADGKKHEAVVAALKSLDKPMLKSKKFSGFLLIEATWKVLLAYGIYTGLDSSVLLAMVAAAGASETAFLGAQAWHDKHKNSDKLKAMNGSTVEAAGELAKE
jgi:hypothetical protein